MKFITSEERHTIAHLLSQNLSPADIARQLGRHKSTITREIKRNADQRNGKYYYDLANRKAQSRQKNKAKRCDYTPSIQAHVEQELAKWHSPEQIVGDALKLGIDCVSIETIYLKIWADKMKGGKLYEDLRHRSKRYRKRGSAKDLRGKISNVTSIDMRPGVVDERKRLGDLEIDLIIGSGHNGAILTINDRVSGLLIMEQLTGKLAAEVTAATIVRLQPYKDHIHTITSDNGKEFAGHQEIAKALEIDFFFAHTYHSWERGSNENLNGLVRQYIPKGTNIATLPSELFPRVEKALNDRPRKRHGYCSPEEKHQQLTDEEKVALVN
jgi:transposase, IS30 family